MGERRFLLVDSSALPDVFLKVLQAKELLASGSVSNISTAARQAGISRSAFYKYKDYVFDAETGREAITVIATLLDKTGALQSLLSGISAAGASVVTITQSRPENGTAQVEVTVRTGAIIGVGATKRLSAVRWPGWPVSRLWWKCTAEPESEHTPPRRTERNTGCGQPHKEQGEYSMAKIAIMGFGTVGSGVLEVCRRNAASIARRAGEPVEVKYILDVRDFSDSPDAALFVKDINVILNDPEVKVVVETIGGTRFAYPYVRQCLESGRSVCTSNKEMVATYGAELLALAREHKAAFLFEASVGGGTPIITPMHQCLAANQISQIQGIVNGTTNFMLTKMKRESMGFDAALKIAQQLGYAETKDPGDDVDGRDACRKIAILSSLACGHHVYPDNIPARGIRDVAVEDVKAAEQLDCAIKLIAWYHENPEGAADAFSAGVEPMLVPESNQLAGVNDVFNAVLMQGDMLGDVVFYGKGAGKLPTASAVVADVIDALKDGSKIHDSLFWKPAEKLDHQLMDTARYSYYIRTAGVPAAALPNVAGPGKLVFDYGDSAAYLIEAATAADLEAVAAKLEVLGGRLALVLKKLPE